MIRGRKHIAMSGYLENKYRKRCFRHSCFRWIRVFVVAAQMAAITVSGCASGGRVLHVDNRETVPYTTADMKLKWRIVRVLARRKLISRTQQYTCKVNIMEIGRFYVLEVWPNGVNASGAFSVKLKKPFLIPVDKHSGGR